MTALVVPELRGPMLGIILIGIPLLQLAGGLVLIEIALRLVRPGLTAHEAARGGRRLECP